MNSYHNLATLRTYPIQNDSFDNYKVLRQINKGAFAQVFEGEHLKTQSKVALKIVINLNINLYSHQSIQSSSMR